MRDLKRLESIIKAYPQNITDSSSIAVEMIEYDICDRRGIKHEWSSIDNEIIEGEIKPQWKEIIQFAIDKEIQKLQNQLEIQTKRVENLKKSNEFYANKANWFYDFGMYSNEFKSITEEDSEHTEHPEKLIHKYYGGKLARSCQAIDQELEKQLTNGEDSETPQETHTK